MFLLVMRAFLFGPIILIASARSDRAPAVRSTEPATQSPPTGTIAVSGGRTVTVGDSIIVQVNSSDLGSGARLAVTGLPAGVSFHVWRNNENWGADPATFWNDGSIDKAFVISAASTAAPGTYTMKIVATSKSASAITTVPIIVARMPAAPAKQPLTAAPELPSLSRYEATMVADGRKWCDAKTITEASQWEGGVWYYDGARTFFNIADYTHDPSWNECAQYVLSVYRPYVFKGPTQWRIFPHGLRRDAQQNRNAESKRALDTLVAHSALATYLKWNVKSGASREVAYGINAALEALAAGDTRLANAFGPFVITDRLDLLTHVALGQIDQWFVSKTADYVRPFMVGLTAEALIGAYQRKPDPRIPAMLKLAADSLWAHLWLPADGSFQYTDRQAADGTGGVAPAADLNLLIVPLYGWLYQQTGDEKYRTIGDEIFNAGVASFPPFQGKQFSQAFRWSAQYLKWRQP